MVELSFGDGHFITTDNGKVYHMPLTKWKWRDPDIQANGIIGVELFDISGYSYGFVKSRPGQTVEYHLGSYRTDLPNPTVC